jgi:hypothetical protein
MARSTVEAVRFHKRLCGGPKTALSMQTHALPRTAHCEEAANRQHERLGGHSSNNHGGQSVGQAAMVTGGDQGT